MFYPPQVVCQPIHIPYSWLYQLILTADANFKLKLKEKGVVDGPPLGDGWGHWVESKPYQAYVKVYGTQIEVRSSYLDCALSV